MNNIFNKIKYKINKKISYEIDKLIFNQGQILSKINCSKKDIKSINEVEFKVFSQWGDDGIIDWLIHNLDIVHDSFIEFGVEDYTESNTRFLLKNRNWKGLVIDASTENIEEIRSSSLYWQHDLTALNKFINVDNINNFIEGWIDHKNVGLLHIDIDGNDYWIWEAINCIEPTIVVIEYNALFGFDRYVSIPYSKDFYRTKAHYSNLYFGASLPAINELAKRKGYTFIGCNLAGNNAYFIKNEKVNKQMPTPSIKEGFRILKFRECRDEVGKLTYPNKEQARAIIEGLPIFNTMNSDLERL